MKKAVIKLEKAKKHLSDGKMLFLLFN